MSESSNLNSISCGDGNGMVDKLSSCLNDSETPVPPVYKDPNGYIGFERQDLVRVVSKFLDDMGYKKTAQELENESGIKCQSLHVSDILNAIVQGDWSRAIEMVHKVKLNTDASMVELLILERKFAEYLECDDIEAALKCLQLELTPRAPEDDNERRLRHLSTCLICPDDVELQKQLQRVGAHSASRLELVKSVKASIASSELIPTGMLETFIVDSLKSHQFSRGSSRKSALQESSSTVSMKASPWAQSPSRSTTKALFQSPDTNNSNVRIYSLFGEDAKDNDSEIPTNLHPDPPTTCLWTLEGHDKEEIWDISISSNNQLMASGGKDGTIKIWIFSKNPGEPPKHIRTFRPRDEDCSGAKGFDGEDDANYVIRPDEEEERSRHRPFNLNWSHDSTYLLSCSEECNKIFLWNLSDIDPNQVSLNEESPAINSIHPPHVIYNHHTDREATCSVWLPDANKQKTFMSGGSDGELLICGMNGTILAALSESASCHNKSKGDEVEAAGVSSSGSNKRGGGNKYMTFLPPEEDRWLGNEIRDINILNQDIDKLHGLRLVVLFSDNYLILCEIKANDKFDISTLKTSQEYPENVIPSSCQFNFHIINKILSGDTIISFGHICSFVHPYASKVQKVESCQLQHQSSSSLSSSSSVSVAAPPAMNNALHTVAETDATNAANVSFTSAPTSSSSSSSSSANNVRPTIYLPMLIEEGVLKFLEIKGNSLKISTSELSGVIQYRFSLKASMAKYWIGIPSNTNPNIFNHATFACGTENCIIYIWSYDKEKNDDCFDFFGTDDVVKTFDKDDIKNLKRTRLLGHIGPINCVVWNPCYPGYLLSASDDGTICGWGPQSMKVEEKSDSECDQVE